MCCRNHRSEKYCGATSAKDRRLSALLADGAVYGFLANIYYFDIDTPLKRFVASHQSLVRHTDAIHAMVMT